MVSFSPPKIRENPVSKPSAEILSLIEETLLSGSTVIVLVSPRILTLIEMLLKSAVSFVWSTMCWLAIVLLSSRIKSPFLRVYSVLFTLDFYLIKDLRTETFESGSTLYDSVEEVVSTITVISLKSIVRVSSLWIPSEAIVFSSLSFFVPF